jgi:hypothetical protein
MATVIDEFIIEEQLSVVFFFLVGGTGQKDLMQRVIL